MRSCYKMRLNKDAYDDDDNDNDADDRLFMDYSIRPLRGNFWVIRKP